MEKKNLIYLIIGLFIVFSLFIFFPVLSKSFKLKRENKENTQELAKLNNKLGKLEAIDENEIKRRVQLLESIFPSKKPVLNLLNSLERLSEEEEVSFGGIELKPGEIGKVKKSATQNFKISFTINGKLNNISSFISDLERTSPLMKIENLNLNIKKQKQNQEENQEEENLLTAVFSVRVFYQSLPEAIGAIDQPLPVFSDKEREALKTILSYRVFPQIKQVVSTGKENPFLFP